MRADQGGDDPWRKSPDSKASTASWIPKVGRYVRFTPTDIEHFTNAGRVDPIDPCATYRSTNRAS